MEINLYGCHRQFLDSYLSKHKLSLKSLAKATGNVVSISTLSRVVKKDRTGEYTKAFDISLDSWTLLVGNLKLTREEGLQALLLRVKDELKKVDTPLINEVEGLLSKVYGKIEADEINQDTLSREALYIADTYEKLPERFKKSLATESFKVIGFLDALNPAMAQTLEANRQYMKRIIE